MSEETGNGKSTAIARLIAPKDFTEAMQIAEKLSASDLVPRAYKNKPSNIVIAWEMGAEVGLSPMTSLQSIAVIGGKPVMYGEAPLAVVMASGLLEEIAEENDGEVATCTVKRRGWPKAITRTFSMDEARKAKVWEHGENGQQGKWSILADRWTYQSWGKDMIGYRARGRALKAVFADVLKGLSIGEEVRDMGDLTVASPGAGTIIDTVAEEMNPFASAKKETSPTAAQGDQAATAPQSARAPVDETAGSPAAGDPPKRTRKAKQSAAGVENPGIGSGAPAAESLDPVCKNVRLADGVRCSGPAGHEGECMYEAPAAAGAEDCPTVGCWAGAGHEGDHVFEPDEDGGGGSEQTGAVGAVDSAAAAAGDGRGADVSVGAAAAETPASTAVSAPDVEPGPQSFKVGDRIIETAGMTEQQFRESLLLATSIDKDHRYANKSKWPKGYARELLRRTLNVVDVEQATRKLLTKGLAEKYLAALRMAAAAGAPQQEIKG